MIEATDNYVMGRSDRERRRLALQEVIFRPFTERLLHAAGIASGMHVLDVGCGVGDATLLAADLVGRSGSVTAVDVDPNALQTLRQRADAQGISNIAYVQTDVCAFRPGRLFDAVVGRLILMHTGDPLAVLKHCYGLLQPRGLAVFQELDFQCLTPSYPDTPLRDRAFGVMSGCFAEAVHANMGSRLFHLFTEAGFAHPNCRGEFPVEGGPDSPYYQMVAETVRVILPRAEALNVPGAAGIDIDTLEHRLRKEGTRTSAGLPGWMMFGCFARRA
jgi:SAM-dependent methyltransferase